MELTGAKIFFKTLKQENVDAIFGYPGGTVMDIYDEMTRQDIKHILVRHEQGAIHAADGYARVSGNVGVCLVTSGPGATNTVTGIANAHMDSIPVVVFTGQVPTAMIGSTAFQEVDITGITMPCTKRNFLVRRVEELGATIKEAFHIARTGRPGPVLVDLPKDVIQSVTKGGELSYPLSAPDNGYNSWEKKCPEILDLITKARKPLLITGGGVIRGNASHALRLFAKTLNIPVTSTLMGIGAFPGADSLWLGMPGMHGTYYANMAISHCDLLIAIGVRFDDRVTSKVDAFAPHARIIHIDIDPAIINKSIRADLAIVGDCKSILEYLNHRINNDKFNAYGEQIGNWIHQIMQWKREVPLGYCKKSEKIKPQEVIEKLNRLTGGEAIITTDVGQHQMWTAQFYRFDHPRTFVSSGGLGTMGFGLPAAIGAQVACPDKLVIDIAGDGSIQMNIQELATAVNYRLPVKVVILNNHFLGMPRQWQEFFYGRRYSQTGISHIPDFVKLAEAYGAHGLRATRPEEVETLLRQGLDIPGVVVMDFHVEPEECVYPMVKPGAPLTEMVLDCYGIHPVDAYF